MWEYAQMAKAIDLADSMSRERRKLPQRGLGWQPHEKAFYAIWEHGLGFPIEAYLVIFIKKMFYVSAKNLHGQKGLSVQTYSPARLLS